MSEPGGLLLVSPHDLGAGGTVDWTAAIAHKIGQGFAEYQQAGQGGRYGVERIHRQKG